MRFLRVLGLVLVDPGAAGHVFGAIARLDLVACGRHSFGRHVDAVGPHVGDVSGLVEALGGVHRLAGTEPELAARLLLEGRGHERGGRVAACGLCLDRRHRKIARADRLDGQFRLGLVREVVAVEFLAREIGEPRRETLAARRFELGLDRPVLACVEGLDLHLALDDQPQADRLHPTGRTRAGQLAPEHRREVEADEIVECPARQIGIDQRRIDLARVLHRFGDRGLGDRVENHPADGGVFLDRLAFAQGFFEVPGDRLTFAVGVGGEDQLVVILQSVGDGLDVFAAVRAHFPGHLEIVLGVDRAVLRGEVAHMPVGGQHGVTRAEILVDRLGFGRAFDNDNGHENPFDMPRGTGGVTWVAFGGIVNGR